MVIDHTLAQLLDLVFWQQQRIRELEAKLQPQPTNGKVAEPIKETA